MLSPVIVQPNRLALGEVAWPHAMKNQRALVSRLLGNLIHCVTCTRALQPVYRQIESSSALEPASKHFSAVWACSRVLICVWPACRKALAAEAPAAVAYQRKRLANHVEVFDVCAALQLSKVQQVVLCYIGWSSYIVNLLLIRQR